MSTKRNIKYIYILFFFINSIPFGEGDQQLMLSLYQQQQQLQQQQQPGGGGGGGATTTTTNTGGIAQPNLQNLQQHPQLQQLYQLQQQQQQQSNNNNNTNQVQLQLPQMSNPYFSQQLQQQQQQTNPSPQQPIQNNKQASPPLNPAVSSNNNNNITSPTTTTTTTTTTTPAPPKSKKGSKKNAANVTPTTTTTTTTTTNTSTINTPATPKPIATTTQPDFGSRKESSPPLSNFDSDSDDDDSYKKNRSRQNQNLASRNYRQRKKEYIRDIEEKLAVLALENDKLKKENVSLKKGGGVEIMKPDPAFITMMMEAKQIIIQLDVAIKKNDERSLIYLLQLFHISIEKRHAIVEKEVEKMVHPYTQAKLAAMGYVPSLENPMISSISGPSSDNWWSRYMTAAAITDEQAKAIKELRANHWKADIELRNERENEILEFTRKLESLKKNFVKQRTLMEDTHSALSSILTPKQEAMLLVRVHASSRYDFANMEMLKNVWGSVVSKDAAFPPPPPHFPQSLLNQYNPNAPSPQLQAQQQLQQVQPLQQIQHQHQQHQHQQQQQQQLLQQANFLPISNVYNNNNDLNGLQQQQQQSPQLGHNGLSYNASSLLSLPLLSSPQHISQQQQHQHQNGITPPYNLDLGLP
ncbi:putative basic-leucine zipper transcription factor [Cavenderia fasciculata]|uniref:Basic-leucine zipper transcription factor n=1 Tax=Cavenderia fasciculata TaxID=261658 RepID=F4Q6Q4_CACFS|nr:putative basic-leucine zipper transcription factor [Cavenderia fasciculata]EGG16564.1 putative basic-leucine zipper transcription factor [Cavenderia fasciculata]|eukprot:XP_004354964.1 putative basic-leucine zipper transcription factor [Cavenderia fasciculata]